MEDLRSFSDVETVKIGFDEYSGGEVSVGKDPVTKIKIIKYTTPYFPKDKINCAN